MSKKITPRGAVRIINKYFRACDEAQEMDGPWNFIKIVMKGYLYPNAKSWREADHKDSAISALREMAQRVNNIADGLEQYEKEREG